MLISLQQNAFYSASYKFFSVVNRHNHRNKLFFHNYFPKKTKAGWTPFEGNEVKAKVTKVTIGGTTVFENGKVTAKPGEGKVLTRKDLKNIIAKKAIIGDMSIPNLRAGGKIFLIGYNMGSVVLYKNCTIGLYGSGLTQLIKALININQ